MIARENKPTASNLKGKQSTAAGFFDTFGPAQCAAIGAVIILVIVGIFSVIKTFTPASPPVTDADLSAHAVANAIANHEDLSTVSSAQPVAQMGSSQSPNNVQAAPTSSVQPSYTMAPSQSQAGAAQQVGSTPVQGSGPAQQGSTAAYQTPSSSAPAAQRAMPVFSVTQAHYGSDGRLQFPKGMK